MKYRERHVFFYRAFVGVEKGSPLPFEGTKLRDAIEALDFDDDSRYLNVDDTHRIRCWTNNDGLFPRLAFAYIRRDDDSRVENHGILRSALVEIGDGLTEFTYFVFLPNNIIGAIFDVGGPKTKRIAEYLLKKCPGVHSEISFGRLVQKDMVDQLDRLGTITQFEIAIHPSQAGLFDDVENSISARSGPA